MTRSYFWDYVDSWCELIELCREEECNICEDIIDDDTLDEYVESDIDDAHCSWRETRDFLADIPTGYDYYRCDGPFDYVGLDDSDFEDYKSRVGEWMDDGEYWEPEDDEADEEDDNFDPNEAGFFSPSPDPVEPTEPPVEEEDFSVSELMCMCSAELVTIRQVIEQRKVEPDDDMSFVLPF